MVWYLQILPDDLSTHSTHPIACLRVSSRLKKDDESLTIPNVNEGDEGTYTCTVKSEIDQDSASARLTVLGTREHVPRS